MSKERDTIENRMRMNKKFQQKKNTHNSNGTYILLHTLKLQKYNDDTDRG